MPPWIGKCFFRPLTSSSGRSRFISMRAWAISDSPPAISGLAEGRDVRGAPSPSAGRGTGCCNCCITATSAQLPHFRSTCWCIPLLHRCTDCTGTTPIMPPSAVRRSGRPPGARAPWSRSPARRGCTARSPSDSGRRTGSRRSSVAGSAPGRGSRPACRARLPPATNRASAPNQAARACRDAADGRRSPSTGASSTLRPAYITTTRSHISATTPRSCVISMIAEPSRFFRSRIRSRICAWIVTSSAVVGSSAISSCGLHASAMAIITRCRMPPDS